MYAPIGTEIGAGTPEELAVSIVGELIQVRACAENSSAGQKQRVWCLLPNTHAGGERPTGLG